MLSPQLFRESSRRRIPEPFENPLGGEFFNWSLPQLFRESSRQRIPEPFENPLGGEFLNCMKPGDNFWWSLSNCSKRFCKISQNGCLFSLSAFWLQWMSEKWNSHLIKLWIWQYKIILVYSILFYSILCSVLFYSILFSILFYSV